MLHRPSLRHPLPLRSSKQHVPSFGGQSPEQKASDILRSLHTYIAANIILAQLSGSGRGSIGSYNSEQHKLLQEFIEEVPIGSDGDQWTKKLLSRSPILGLRLIEVRESYCIEEFEFDHLERLAKKDMKESNLKLLRSQLTSSIPQEEQPQA